MIDTPDASGREPETAPPVGVSRRLRYRGDGTQDRLVRVSVIAVIVIGLIASALLLGHRASRTPAAGGSAVNSPALTSEIAAPTAAETGAVMTVLGDHARALLARDSAGWNAGLDADPRAADFSDEQRGAFANLARVPLTTWRYSLVAPVTDPAVLRPAAARLGGRVVVLHVQLTYGLATVDPQPTSRDQWLTAVLRGSSWVLAGDSDVSGAGGASWHGLWDFGPVVTRAGPHTLVLAHPDRAADLATFAALVERAIPVVQSVWGPGWNEHVAILIPDTAQEFAAVTSDSADTSDLAAVSVADQVLPDGTVLGARIVMNPANLSKLDPAGRRLVVQHELTHIADRAATVDQMPTWVIEGFADFVGNLGTTRSTPAIASELAAEVRAGKVPKALPTDAEFAGANPRLAQVYEEAWLACRLIQRRVGTAGLVRFYKAVSAAAVNDPGTSAEAGFRSILHSDVSAFTAQWRAFIEAELR